MARPETGSRSLNFSGEPATRAGSRALDALTFGMPWNSLWTGHLGVALYLAACIEGDDRMPPFDY
jgi:hypothetical protein